MLNAYLGQVSKLSTVIWMADLVVHEDGAVQGSVR